jgi:hypothetical protein
MNKLSALSIAAGILVAGCSDPRMEVRYNSMQPVALGDNNLTCSELQAEIARLDNGIANMDYQVSTLEQQAVTTQALAGFQNAMNSMVAMQTGGSFIDNSALARGAVASDNTEAGRIARVRQTWQERRNLLTRQFFAKNC